MPSTTPIEDSQVSITDPVTGFVYPMAWIEACRDPAMRRLAATGLGVLTSGGKVLRRGFSTGTTAAAACMAGILSLKGPVREVRIRIPCGLVVTVPATGTSGHAEARKFPGDYPGDATAGLLFCADARKNENGIVLIAGEGIGRFCRDTPRNKAGEPAISTSALQCIMDAIDEALSQSRLPGVVVTLSVPGGEGASAHTLNPRLGILGGISILGTTGLVEPWDDHLSESMLQRVEKADRLVITTGRLGLRYSRLLFPDHDVVLAGSRIREAVDRAPGEVILCGLPGLVLKFLDPGILDGTGCTTVEELASRPGFEHILKGAFSKARERFPGLRVVVISRDGDVMGDSL